MDVHAARELRIATAGVTRLDLSGAWVLREFVRRARAAGAEVSRSRANSPISCACIDETLKDARPRPPRPRPRMSAAEASGALSAIGRYAVAFGRHLVLGLAFLGRSTSVALASAGGRARLRPISIARHVYDTGITAMPIVALIAFLISVIIAYMSAQQLRGLGADIYVVDLVTIGVLRELGVLLTSIIVAGRSGSAFAAELGSMELNEEVDALTATGVNPYEVLVLPRLLGLAIALPLLTIIADLVGLDRRGAAVPLSARHAAHASTSAACNDAISPTHLLGRTPQGAGVRGADRAWPAAIRGMQVRDSSRELGRQVTQAVVQAIFLVILADALFAVLFMEMDL